jgi:sugar lactone lactonase YvrE
MSPEAAPRAVLYRLDSHGGWQTGDSGFVVCNGPAFLPRGDVLYFNDTIDRQTLTYDLDASGRPLAPAGFPVLCGCGWNARWPVR